MKPTFKKLSILCLFLAFLPAFIQADPFWWQSYGVLNGGSASDYAAVNQGQLKNMAARTRDYFNASLPGGAGSTIDTLINSWATTSSATADYSVVNSGQLKTVAQPFYDRLIALSYKSGYPWTTSTGDDQNYSLANIGQVKNLFSFDLNQDSNFDGLTDETSLAVGISPFLMDVDGDGVSNAVEVANGTNPFMADSDGDGYNDNVDYYPLDSDHWLTPSGVPGDHTPPTITLTKPVGAVLLP